MPTVAQGHLQGGLWPVSALKTCDGLELTQGMGGSEGYEGGLS